MDESGENPTPHHSTLSKLDDDFRDIAQHHILSVAGKQFYLFIFIYLFDYFATHNELQAE